MNFIISSHPIDDVRLETLLPWDRLLDIEQGMKANRTKHALVLYNPFSGAGRALKLAKRVYDIVVLSVLINV